MGKNLRESISWLSGVPRSTEITRRNCQAFNCFKNQSILFTEQESSLISKIMGFHIRVFTVYNNVSKTNDGDIRQLKSGAWAI